MQITRSTLDTQKGPADWFTGENHWHGAAPNRFLIHNGAR